MIFYVVVFKEVTDTLSTYLSYSCLHVGDELGLSVEGANRVYNTSVTVYQHLQCPQDMYGPGCEYRCDCPEQEACHYIKGGHQVKRRDIILSALSEWILNYSMN